MPLNRDLTFCHGTAALGGYGPGLADSAADRGYFVAKLIAPGDAFRKPLLPGLYEPVLTSLGNGTLVLRGFEREGEAATVQEWRCECI
jgi:hypothetical protein